MAREAAQVRRTEFLAATANPVDMQIMGVEGRAAVLRETAKTLQMDTDKVVPDTDTLRQKLQTEQALAQQQQAAANAAPGPPTPRVAAPPWAACRAALRPDREPRRATPRR